MSHWWRAHDDAVDNPKLGALSDRQHRAWFNLCCICSQNGGTLPAIGEVAFKLRVKPDKAKHIVAELAALRLVDVAGDGATTMHNWDSRQFKSDRDPTNAARQDRYRKRHPGPLRNGSNNGTDNVPAKRPDTEQTRTETEEDTADAVPSSATTYAFESGIIRLCEKDFSNWQASFSYLDLKAELIGLTQWAGEQGPDRWFFAVSGALAKRNREAKSGRQKNGEFKLMSGIEGVV